ncbi:MAG: hypothetical protein PHG47_02580 [Sulfuricella sp.]|nr:hypothetical protein [Sulfuricella sp.]
MIYSAHAKIRAQQRGIPPIVEWWLDEFGEPFYDGHGGIVTTFTKESVREMEKSLGREPVRRMSEFFKCYKVESSHDGTVITLGKRSRRFQRK